MRKIIILLLIVAIVLILCIPKFINQQPQKVIDPITVHTRSNISTNWREKPTLFLTWTTRYRSPYKAMIQLFDSCPELNCAMTLDRRLLKESSAILFFLYDLNWSDIPAYRRSDQYYVFQIWESPVNSALYGANLTSKWEYRKFFNLTFTHRLDSTVAWPYGVFEKINGLKKNNDSLTVDELRNLVGGKFKLLAWFVSNCKSEGGRERFVQELQKFTPVDIYSDKGCGPLKCPNGPWSPYAGLAGANPCERILTKDYKFYLSLENTLCKDYVTEKFYYRMEKSVIVPIVLERKIVMDTVKDPETANALNRSFIAVDDFANVQKLYEYLKYLDTNMTAYLEYHEWRWNFQVDNNDPRPGCDLCRLVKEKQQHLIQDIHKWWNDEANCHSYKSRAS